MCATVAIAICLIHLLSEGTAIGRDKSDVEYDAKFKFPNLTGQYDANSVNNLQ